MTAPRPARVLLAVVCAAAAMSRATPARSGLRETLAEGNEAFWRGDFEAAAQRYEELVELGVRDPDLYYNLGTAYGRAGRHGLAILNFERALALRPGHGDARQNLGAVRRTLARRRTAQGEDADLDPPSSLWLSMLERVTLDQLAIPMIACWVSLFALLCWRRLSRGDLRRLVLAVAGSLLGVAALTLATLFASKAYFDARVREAVVVGQDQVELREGPSEGFGQGVSLREGDRVRVLDEDRGFLLVRDRRGREGWGQASEFGDLRPELGAPPAAEAGRADARPR